MLRAFCCCCAKNSRFAVGRLAFAASLISTARLMLSFRFFSYSSASALNPRKFWMSNEFHTFSHRRSGSATFF